MSVDDTARPDPAVDEVVEEAVPDRAELLPEEVAAGSDDPIGQAEAILAESEERTLNPEPEIRRTAEEATGGVEFG
jgi:hypothetical protein